MTDKRTLEQITPFLGRDLRLEYALSGGFFEDADLATRRRREQPAAPRDLDVAGGLDAMQQAIANRLKTRQGELAPLGHPEYGSRHHELMGQPNVERTRNLVKLYVLQALRDEPRIAKVLEVRVTPEHDPPRDTVQIALTVELVDSATPLNLVVPFSFEVTP
jgi:phage baseplate assembly protein W